MHGVVICEVCLDGERYIARLDQPRRLHIPLRFDGAQPRHFGAPPARARPLEVGGFVGDVRRGGSCNAVTLELTPHCNGTHTEGPGHLAREAPDVDALLTDTLLPATLVSVTPDTADGCGERALHDFLPGDRLITARLLEAALAGRPLTPALIVRTLPNGAEKCAMAYEGVSPAPYFTLEAARLLVAREVRHLLVDLPSVDRAHDEGRLGAHREFWGMQDAATAPAPARRHCTITELIYAADDVPDGAYLLNLQIAPFRTDAAPSRLIVFPLESA